MDAIISWAREFAASVPDWAGVPILFVGSALALTGVVVGFQSFGRADEIREVMDQGGGLGAFLKGELSCDTHETGPTVGQGLDIWEERDGTVRGQVKTQAV